MRPSTFCPVFARLRSRARERRAGRPLDLRPRAPVAVLRGLYSMSGAGSSARGSWSSQRDARTDPTDGGGPRAGHGSGASLGTPTCSSILWATRRSVISAIGFIRARQLGHSNTSIAKTRCISSAHRSPRSCGGAQLCAAADRTRNAVLAAVIAATSALVGGAPRPSFTT